MRINIYDNWVDDPSGYKRPFKTSGSPKLYLDTKKHSPIKILARLSKIAKVPQKHEGESNEKQYLVLLVGEDYENSLTGSAEQIHRFVRDCLADEGLMSKSWGRKK